VILGVAVALIAVSVPLLGGALSRLADVRFRGVGYVAASLALQVLIISVIGGDVPRWFAVVSYLLSYGLAAAFLWSNRGVPWLWLITVGGLSNLTAMGANGGVMPASSHALAAAGRTQHSGRFRNSTDITGAHLRVLGDIFAVPRGWPLANVFSIGDVMLVAGAALLLHTVCQSRPARWHLPGRVLLGVTTMRTSGDV